MLHVPFFCGEGIVVFVLTEKEDSHSSNFSHRAEEKKTILILEVFKYKYYEETLR